MSPVSMVTRCDLLPASLSPRCSSLAPVTLKHVHFLINDSQIQLAHVLFHFDPFTNVHTHSSTHTHALFKGPGVYDWRDRFGPKWSTIFKYIQYPEKYTLCVFFNLRMSLSCPQRQQILFHEVHHLTVPCFYSSSDETNHILTLKMTCHCFHEFLQPSWFFEDELRVFQ